MRRIFTLKTLPLLCGLLCFTGKSYAQAPVEKVLIVSPIVGEVIDAEEKAKYKLFPFYPDADFQVGRFLQNAAGDIVLETMLKNGKVLRRPYTKSEFDLTSQWLSADAGSPEVKTVTPVTVDSNPSLSPSTEITNGKTLYLVILDNNLQFFATVTEKRKHEYVFMLKEGSTLTAPFKSIKYMRETDSKLHRGVHWTPAPQDSRMYFAPTGYGLKRGDGYFQDIDLFIIAANYGITDNFSIGGMATIFPFLPIVYQAYSITPKLSFKTSRQTSVAGGVLFANVFDNSFGIVYGAGTYGNSNNHLTGGIGYGFFNGSLSKTPVYMAGGAVRATNRVGFMSENYIVSIKNTTYNGSEVTDVTTFGLYGLRFLWPTINFDIAWAYWASPGEMVSSLPFPWYYSVTFKFGNKKIVGKAQ